MGEHLDGIEGVRGSSPRGSTSEPVYPNGRGSRSKPGTVGVRIPGRVPSRKLRRPKLQTIWMCGLAQAGKTTLARQLEDGLRSRGLPVEVIDGDQIRSMAPTGFDPGSIDAHLRRLAITCRLLNKHGVFSIVSCISPLVDTRLACRDIVGRERWTLVHVATPLDRCRTNDSTGIYSRDGVSNLAGVDVPFEEPDDWEEPHFDHVWEDGDEAVELMSAVFGHRGRPASLYVGRWQPLHRGHERIVRVALDQGERVVIGVRDTPRTERDPYPFELVREMFYLTFGNEVEVIQIPDIGSINIGRAVGYEVREIQNDPSDPNISATEIRRMISEGDEGWKAMVPAGVVGMLEGITPP